MRRYSFLWLVVWAVTFYACTAGGNSPALPTPELAGQSPESPLADSVVRSIIREVPVLCYHQIRPYRPTDNADTRAYTVTPEAFAAQMKALYDRGYQAILPDDLFAWYTRHKPLPHKPILLTFDDGTEGHFSEAVPVMNRYGFKGTFFIMTVTLGKKGYLGQPELQALVKAGHVVGNHSWDHHNVTQYTHKDWPLQIDEPQRKLEAITGQPVAYFAYPNGLWNQRTIDSLKIRRYRMAFILQTSRHTKDSLYTVRRLMANGAWDAADMLRAMEKSFPGSR